MGDIEEYASTFRLFVVLNNGLDFYRSMINECRQFFSVLLLVVVRGVVSDFQLHRVLLAIPGHR